MTAKDWNALNVAADAFTAPAQTIVFAQKVGGIGLRVSGVGIRRRRSGLVPQPATGGEWLGLESVSQRPRIFFPPGETPRFISTANQRLWLRGWGEHWTSDNRQDRIQTLFEQSGAVSAKDMRRFQLDTQSRHHQMVLQWVARHADADTQSRKQWVDRYRAWDGVLRTDEVAFAHAYYAQGLMSALALERIRARFLPEKDRAVEYDSKMHGAWELALLGVNVPGDPWKAFGLTSKEVAQWVLNKLDSEAGRLKGYAKANGWKAQHPFVRGVPFIGRFFAVDAHPQVGFDTVVRVERPFSGASTRLVWDLKDPAGNVWAFPVGQSGHVLSSGYAGFRKRWFAEQFLPALVD
jgi:acyl-homoserine lactone acylase PvdQ